MPRFLFVLVSSSVLWGCGGSTIGDPTGKQPQGQPQTTPDQTASPETACGKYDVVNEGCRVLENTPELARRLRASQLTFQQLAADRQAIRQACHAIAGKLGAAVEDALLEPDVAAPICEVAAQALHAESATFEISRERPTCHDTAQPLCAGDEVVALAECPVDAKAAAVDAKRPDLVERLGPSVAQYLAAVAAVSANAERFVDAGVVSIPPSPPVPTICAFNHAGALASGATSIIRDAVAASAALRE